MWSGPTPGYSTPTWALRRMTMTSRSAEHVTTGAPALEIQDVVAGYGGGDVLHGVNMQVYEGGITCVVGPNGAGKSTLLGTISGLLDPRVADWLGKKAGSLPGAQQRLVEFARCLMLAPSLVILDEPSMGLSPKVLKSVFDAVRLMHAQGKTILLVEQNARAGLRLSTHGVVLENGRVRLAGSGHEVLHHPEIGALYLGGAVTDPAAASSPAAGA